MLNRSKLWATVLLAAAFAAGIAVGGAAQAALAERGERVNSERGRRLSYVERLERDLQLTPEQRDMVAAIMDTHEGQMRQIWGDARGRVDEMRIEIRSEITDLLDQRQRDLYAALNARHDSLHAAGSRSGARR